MGGRAVTEREIPDAPSIRAPDFVGRDREMGALADALAAGPAVVLVEGEAGIGKSRLIQEYLACASARENRALVACCPPLRTPLTLGPVVDAARQATDSLATLELTDLGGALRPLFPEWANDLPPALEPVSDATVARHRVFRALGELLSSLAVNLLVVEDAHWADEATVEFLLFLVARQPRPVNLLVTFRPEDVPDGALLPRLFRHAAGGSGVRLTLRPLDVAETARLVSSMLDDMPVSGRFAGLLHEHTDGLPLALEESVRLLHERADLRRFGAEWMRHRLDDIAVPPSVRDAVLERAYGLGPDTQAVLRAAAVLAEPSPEGMLAVVARLQPGPARQGLCAALSSGLLTMDCPGGQRLVSFRHALAARAIYEATPVPERQEMHLGAGQTLEQSSPLPLALLTRHFHEANETDKWRYYAERAADQALAAGDQARAATLLYDMVSAGGTSPGELARLVRKIPLNALSGYACLGDLTQCLRSVLSTEALTPALRAEIGFLLGRILLTADDYEAGLDELERAIPHLTHRPVDAAHAMIGLGWPSLTLWPARAHRRWLDRAAAAVDLVPSGDRLALLVDRATALLKLGDEAGWAAAAELPGGETTSGESLEVVRGFLNTGYAVMLWGRYGESARRLTAALDLAGTHGFILLRDMTLVSRAHLDWFTGSWTGLADRLAVLGTGDDTEPMARLEARLVAGLLDMAQQPQEAGEESLRLVLAESQRYGVLDMTLEPAAALARLQLRKGYIEDALELTQDPIRVIETKEIWIWATDVAPVRVQALCAADRDAEAAELIAAFARGLRGRDAPGPRAGLATCRAMLADARGEHDRAAGLFANAAAAWAALPRPYEGFLAGERQAHCLIAAGRRDSGLVKLTDVMRGLSELGASGDAARLARSLREHGRATHRPGAGRPSYGSRLSPRELAVVRLVITGQTNQEIATALFLSPKTVARHIDSAKRKLQVTSRTTLAVKAVEAGVIAAQEQ